MEISVRPQSESLSHMFWGFLLGGKEICLCCAPQLQVWVKMNHIFSNIFLSAHILSPTMQVVKAAEICTVERFKCPARHFPDALTLIQCEVEQELQESD